MDKHWEPDEYSQELPKPIHATAPPVNNQPLRFERPKFDRNAYQREYMRKRRAKQKEQK